LKRARFLADQSGTTAIEYALIAAGISLAIIATVNGLGSTSIPLTPRSAVR
jgi:pilus assembly protein Flp/PilA